MGFTFTSPNTERMSCEPGTLSSARPGHPREGATGHHVAAGRLAPAFLHRNARRIEHDRREPHRPYAHFARGGLRLGDKGVSERPALDDRLAEPARAQSV